MFYKFLKNSQVRLLFSGSLFAVAFIWMAIESYGVEEEVIRVFLILSLMFVGVLIVCGFAFSLLMSVMRRDKGGLLSKIESEEEQSSVGSSDHEDK